MNMCGASAPHFLFLGEAFVMKKKRAIVVKSKRTRVAKTEGSYFINQSSMQFISSGAGILNSVLGGGWPLGRVVNVVGDRSTGKTLLAIEACANFLKKYPKGMVFYLEAEAAFDKSYAKALGLPVEKIEFVDNAATIEDWSRSLEAALAECKKSNTPALYIVDSFDALSDTAEMKRDIDDGSFGAAKAKKSSELFRKLTKKIEQSKMCLFVISQIRDKLNVTFGKKHSRSGGKALDFYASQIIHLAEVGKIWKTVDKVKRPIGVTVRVNVEKNKVGLPYRQCQIDILFGYGIDSLASALAYLEEVGQLHKVDPKLNKANKSRYLSRAAKMDDDEYKELVATVDAAVTDAWRSVETSFLPTRSKY